MTEKQDYTRRLFLRRFLSAGLITVAGSTLLTACGEGSKKDGSKAQDTTAKSSTPAAEPAEEEFKCGDYSNVSPEEMAKRKKLGYEEETSDPERPCRTCNLFIPKGEGKECGGCILFKGPVNNEGSCTYWAEQVS